MLAETIVVKWPLVNCFIFFADDITEVLHRNFSEIAPRELIILSDLSENAESESVRLGKTRDPLNRASDQLIDTK